jgi:predicted RNA-binding protein (virulence factor B family)
MGMTTGELVDKYVELRDRKAEIAKTIKTKTDKIDAAMKQIEAILLKKLEAEDEESIRTASGTVYKSVKTGVRVADWDAVLAHILENEAYEMLTKGVSKDAVKSYREEHDGDIPPGVNLYEEITINIRRS